MTEFAPAGSPAILIDVATGRSPADRVVRNGRWVNVHSGEILPGHDVVIAAGRVAAVVPDAGHAVGPDTEVIDAAGRYLVPGLCDPHMHVESTMMTASGFAAAVIPHGTTSAFVDPHEIANVLGLAGVRLIHDECAGLPINVYVQMPSCVPSAPGLENAGAVLGVDEVTEAMGWPNIVGLGEVMNYPGVAAGDPKMLGQIAATRAAGKIVGGHYASPDLGRAFAGYVAGGAADDHEGTRMQDAVARVRQGMRVMMRLGSAWYDVAEQIRAVTEGGLDPRWFVLCTDDSHAGTLVRDGHMDRVVRHAISRGLRPVDAIRMASLNVAEHFGLERELGSITPGRRADLILTSDLVGLPVETVIARGEVVAVGGAMTRSLEPFEWPASARDTVRLARPLVPDDFRVRVDGAADADGNVPVGAEGRVTARVIGVVERQAPTRALRAELPVVAGIVEVDADADVCHVAVVERHRGTGGVVNGFVNGFGYDRPCALASTVAHDAHQLIVAGTSRTDMALAANRLAEVGGGFCFFVDGTERALVEMPVAGLMSEEGAEAVAAKSDALQGAMREAGCALTDAHLLHTFLGLAVIPELRISDVGILDVTRFEIVPLLVGETPDDVSIRTAAQGAAPVPAR